MININKKLKAEEKVRLYIQENIASQKFLPNMKLVEEDIAKELNISRSPVRAALKKMEKENVVRLIPNKGAYIAPKQLSTKEFVDRMQLFELFLIHTLVRMEQWDYQFLPDEVPIFEQINERSEIKMEELNDLQNMFFHFQKNDYLTDSFKTIVKEVLVYSEVSPLFNLRKLALLIAQLFFSLVEKVQRHEYGSARKQVRVFVNAISLDVIDNQEIHEQKYLF